MLPILHTSDYRLLRISPLGIFLGYHPFTLAFLDIGPSLMCMRVGGWVGVERPEDILASFHAGNVS